MTKLCIIVDRSGYENEESYTEEDPTKTIYLEFVFLDAEGNPLV